MTPVVVGVELRVVDEQARQLEKRREPGNHEDDVEGLEPEHRCLTARYSGGDRIMASPRVRTPLPPRCQNLVSRLAAQYHAVLVGHVKTLWSE